MTELYRRNGSVPTTLPRIAYDDDGRAWTDLANNAPGREACGFIPAPPKPDSTETQYAQWDQTSGEWVMVDRPPPPEPAPPQPRILGKLEFIGLVQSVGGMTDQMLKQAYKDANLEAFWVKYQMASEVVFDHPVTGQALAALEALGYLPNGAQAVLNAWPTQ